MTTTTNDTQRTALVTGASSGIGEAIARELATAGMTVAVAGRDEACTRAVASDIERQGGRAVPLVADLSGSSDEARALATAAIEQLGGHVDVLVNNAGVYPGGPTESLSDDTVDALLATNIRAPRVLVAALAPAMASQGGGNIVNIGSWMARGGVPFMALYPATKTAVEQLTRAWAAEYGHRGIRVVTVAPDSPDCLSDPVHESRGSRTGSDKRRKETCIPRSEDAPPPTPPIHPAPQPSTLDPCPTPPPSRSATSRSSTPPASAPSTT
jgi:3-oxoacyl-[acyl-carrier protein] reductase